MKELVENGLLICYAWRCGIFVKGGDGCVRRKKRSEDCEVESSVSYPKVFYDDPL